MDLLGVPCQFQGSSARLPLSDFSDLNALLADIHRYHSRSLGKCHFINQPFSAHLFKLSLIPLDTSLFLHGAYFSLSNSLHVIYCLHPNVSYFRAGMYANLYPAVFVAPRIVHGHRRYSRVC